MKHSCSTGPSVHQMLLLGLLLSLGVASVGAAPPSPAQATLSSVAFDRAALAAEISAALKSGAGGEVEVIVTLEQPDPAPQAAGMDKARCLAECRARNNAAAANVLARLSAPDFRERRRFDNFAGFTGKVSGRGLQRLLADPAVRFVEPVRMLEAHLAQGISLMNAMEPRSSHSGSGVAVAVCDTGIDYTHPRLGGGGFPNGKVLGGYDFGDDDTDPRPNTQAHGTSCAGIVAGEPGMEGDYIGGLAYGAGLYALKISSGDTGSAGNAAMISAWDWCVTHQNDDPSCPIMVISTSFGGGRYCSGAEGDAASPGMTIAANNAVAAGITVLASSGNDGFCDATAWPACISSVISVGAVYDAAFGAYLPCVSAESCAQKIVTNGCYTGYYVEDATDADKVTAYSNSAPFLTLLAPSNACHTLDIVGESGYDGGDYFSSFGGTSAACPYAAGAVACLQSAAKVTLGRYLTAAEVRRTLTATGQGVSDTRNAVTKPRIDLEAAINDLPEVKAFVWAPVSSASYAGLPFGVTVTAVNIAGQPVGEFAGPVNIAGLIPGFPEVAIGREVSMMNAPMGTRFHDERTQVVYLASEIGGARPIDALSLYVCAAPLQTLNGWTIRMKHTGLGEFASPAGWEGEGWTNVYRSNETVTATGWVTFHFSNSFDYDGAANLMVDFSFNNAAYTADGRCHISAPGGNRTLWYQTDSGYGDPLTWSGAAAPAYLSRFVPNIRLGAIPDTPVSITPTVAGSFADGVWTGNITVMQDATGMLLRAGDGDGRTGDSNVFDAVTDTEAPVGTIVINNGLSATNNSNVTLDLAWRDVGLGVARMRFSDNGATWSAWEPLKAKRAYTMPGADGYKTVRVQYRDAAGNNSAVFSDYIRLDTTSPAGSILINGGASVTPTPLVTLGLHWSDGAGSGVVRMRFSDNGSTWTYWEPLAAARAFTLPGPGGYQTVRVQYRDAAGNVSPACNDYIRLTAP